MSILYWRPTGSPLRREVEDLWARRNESSVYEMLKPFLKETVKASTSTSEKLLFHMAVMRWKYSLLTPDESAALHQWIDEQHALKDTTRALEWSEEAKEFGDCPFPENVHIQRSVFWIFSLRTSANPGYYSSIDELALTVQVAIEEIERQTGWKAMVILGGLEPRVGNISSHL